MIAYIIQSYIYIYKFQTQTIPADTGSISLLRALGLARWRLVVIVATELLISTCEVMIFLLTRCHSMCDSMGRDLLIML